MSALSQTILDFLVNYLGASAAAFYCRYGHSRGVQRIANYGFRKEHQDAEQILDAGDNLVEQALSSNRIIELNDVPANYVKISSGLGDAVPRYLVLIPLQHEGVTNGVIELGLLHAPKARDIEFLKLVAPQHWQFPGDGNQPPPLARFVRRNPTVERRVWQVQQEELRTANEELEEQSRVLEESQALLENQKAELEQTNEKLDQATALDQKNISLNTVQAELEERAADLQRASKYKSEFLANMSHELRTPLNSSMILAKLLAENAKGNLNQEQIQFANSIYSAGIDLLNLINDILDISKVEAGKLELAPEHIPLQRLVDSLRLTIEPLALQKHLQFTATIDAGVPQSIFTDHQRLEQIIKNLLSNAIKFTEQGQINFHITAVPDGIAFAVFDSGIGIAKEHQSLIFEAFQQADGSISRRYGGTGLGLSISRDLASLLGGNIRVESLPGKGSI